MGLQKLLERVTIEFPISITSDEVEQGLFNYLLQEMACEIGYKISVDSHLSNDPELRGDRSTSSIKGYMKRPLTLSSGVMTSSNFEVGYELHSELPLTFFKNLKFGIVPGYDSIREFESLPSGRTA